MTEENNQTPGNPADGGDDARRNRSRNRIIEYNDADPELRARMEKVMQPIHTDPASFHAVVTFGTQPQEELGKVATSMIEVQRNFDKQVRVLDTRVDSLGKTFKDWDMSAIADATKNLAKGAANAGLKGAVGGVKLVKGLSDAFTGAKKRRGEDEKLIAQMQETLPAMLDEMFRLIDDITKTEDAIKAVLHEAENLGVARIAATRELNVYIGAGKEILRRYADVYIPEAREDYEETADPEDEMIMQDIIARREDFIDQMTVLESSRAQGVIAAQQLKQMMETMQQQLKKIQSIKHNSQNEWKAMLAAAGIAGSSLKAAQTLRKADEFGDKIHDETMKMIEESHNITLNSKSRGTIDPSKLIEASARLQKMIESEHQNRVERNRMLEQTATQLRQATDKILDAAQASEEKRVLESVESAKKAQSNDNGDAKAAKPRRPRRGSGAPEV